MISPRLALVLLSLLVACDHAAKDVAVDDAPNHDGVHQLELTGAKVLLDKGGAYDRPCKRRGARAKGQTGCIDHHFYVFPIVAEEGKRGGPVAAWATCWSGPEKLVDCRKQLADLQGTIGGSVAVRVGDEDKTLRTKSGWERAIEDAVRKHRLKLRPRAPVIRVGDKPS